MDEKTKSTRSQTAPFTAPRPPQRCFKPISLSRVRIFSVTTRVPVLTSFSASKKIVGNFDESKIGSPKANLSTLDTFAGVAGGMNISELTSKITVQCETGPDFGESKTDSIEAVLSLISAQPQLIGIYNHAETSDLSWNRVVRVSVFKDPAPYADCFVDVEGSVEEAVRSISQGMGGVLISPKLHKAPQTGRFGDPFDFGFSQVGVIVEHGGENSSGNGRSGAENAGKERNRSRGGGNGNEGMGGGRQGSRNEGRQGGLGTGGHGGDNGDDDGNNGRDRNHRIVDIENERIPQRNPRQEELVQIYFPIIVGIVGVAFNLDDANLSALGLVLRSFALACCALGTVCFTGYLLGCGRNERMARILSTIGSTLVALALTLIIAIKLLPTLPFIIGLAILALLAIFHRSF